MATMCSGEDKSAGERLRRRWVLPVACLVVLLLLAVTLLAGIQVRAMANAWRIKFARMEDIG